MPEKVEIRLTAVDGTVRVFQAAGNAATEMGRRVEQAGDQGARGLERQRVSMAAVGAASGLLLAGVSKLAQAHVSEERQIDAIGRAYGSQADDILGLADRLQDLGIASDDAVRISALGAQSLAKNYGLTADQIEQLIVRSTDLAAVTFDQYGNQMGLADVMQRVQSAIRGEAESAEVLGVAMSDTHLQSLAAAQGMTGWTTTMTDAEKAQFRFQVLLTDTATAQGAAAAQTEGWTGKLRALKLELGDVASSAGGILGPGAQVVSVVGDIGLGLTGLSVIAAKVKPLLGKGGVAGGAAEAEAASGPAVTVLGRLASVLGDVTATAGPAALAIGEVAYLLHEGEQGTKGLVEEINALGAAMVDLPDPKLDEMWNRLAAQTANPLQVSLTVYGGKEVTASLANYSEDLTRIRQDSDLTTKFLGELGAAGVDLSDGLNADELRVVIAQIELYDAVIQDATLSTLGAVDGQRALASHQFGAAQATHGHAAALDRLNRAEAAQVYQMPAALAAQIEQRDRMIDKLGDEQAAEEDAGRAVVIAERGKQAARERSAASLEDHRDADLAAASTAQHTIAAEVAARSNATRIYLAEQNARGEAINAATAAELAGVTKVAAAYESLSGRDFDLDFLAGQTGEVSIKVGLDTAGAVADLERIYQVGVGNLKSIGSTVDGIQKWGEELINVEGTYGKIDDLLASGVIDQTQWNRAQRAYTSIAGDNLTIRENLLSIQAQQAPVIARQVDVLDEALRKVEGMDSASQAAALGFMDAGEGARFLELQTNLAAAATGQLGEDGQRSMELMLQGIQATDPYLTAMAEKAGLVKVDDSTGTITVNWAGLDADGASPLDKVATQLERLAGMWEVAIHVDLDGDGVIGQVKQDLENLTADPIEWPVNLKLGGGSGDASAVDQLLALGGIGDAIDVPVRLTTDADAVDQLLSFGGLGERQITVDVYSDTGEAESTFGQWLLDTGQAKPFVTVGASTDTADNAVAQALADYETRTASPDIGADTSGGDATVSGVVTTWDSMAATVAIGADPSGYYANLPPTGVTIGTNYIDVVQRGGGVGPGGGFTPAFATGGVVIRGGEVGPEAITIPGQAMRAIAPSDGLYSVPSGSYVSPAAATRGQLGGSAASGITITGPVYITATTPDVHEAINSQLLNQARR